MGVLLGFPKSSYHYLLIGMLFYTVYEDRWSARSRNIVRSGMILVLVLMSIKSFFYFDFKFDNKYTILQLYTLWGAIIISKYRGRLYYFIPLLMFIDIALSLKVAARGVLISTLTSLALVIKSISRKRVLILSFFFGFLLIYILAAPVFMLFDQHDILKMSASNSQRSAMNYSALSDVLRSPLLLDENLIYESASRYKFEYDDNRLTVHNLILAFGLFNGLLPGLLLLFLIFMAINRLIGSPYLPFAGYLFFVMMLGPDSSVTRISLIFLAGLVIIDSERHLLFEIKNYEGKFKV